MSGLTKPDPTKRWWDALSMLLVMVCLFIATLRLIATHWTENLGTTQVIAFFGVILGAMLGQSIFSRRVCIFFAVSYGVFVIPWQLGLSMEKEVVSWVEKLINMQGRLAIIIGELATRESVTDNLLFILVMLCLFWALSVHAGYIVTRQAHPWKTILPLGLAIFAIHSFDALLTRRSWYLAFYLFFAMLLVARLVYLHKRELWRQSRTHTPSDLGFDFSRFAVVASIALVLLAWNIPVLTDSLAPVSKAWVTITRPWQSFKDRFGYAFASLRASVGVVTNMYGESMMLGHGTPLGNNIVFEAEVPDITLNGARLYWRGRVYDIYNNGGWNNSFNARLSLTPDSLDLEALGIDLRQDISVSITTYDAISLLYLAAQPLWVSRSSTASVTTNTDGTIDLGSLTVNEYIRPGERYQTRSSLSTVSIADLRDAGTDYPQWVLDKYLQLPENITPRTYELAQRIATGKETPYDVANAITNYLRTNIKYSTSISESPLGQERVDWFLFDLREGYCNYYATAEVVLLRSLGIPARLAVGFAQGERVEPAPNQEPGRNENSFVPDENGIITYVVRQRDAHAWPEVYFPGIGWVEFEPTGSQDALVRPFGEELPVAASDIEPRERDMSSMYQMDDEYLSGLDIPDNTALQGEFWTPRTIFFVVLSFILVLVVLFIIWQVRRGFRFIPYIERLANRVPVSLERSFLKFGIRPPQFLSQWANYVRLPSLSRSYLQVNGALNRLGRPPEACLTPTERVSQLVKILPSAEVPARIVLGEYQAAMYSSHAADDVSARQASSDLRKQSYLELFHRRLARLKKPLQRRLPK